MARVNQAPPWKKRPCLAPLVWRKAYRASLLRRSITLRAGGICGESNRDLGAANPRSAIAVKVQVRTRADEAFDLSCRSGDATGPRLVGVLCWDGDRANDLGVPTRVRSRATHPGSSCPGGPLKEDSDHRNIGGRHS